MTLTITSKETSPSSGYRDRSYSDGHALLENSSPNDTAITVAMTTAAEAGTDTTIDKTITTSPWTIHKTTCFKKHHAQNHHHSHHVNQQRPRSKSLDLHRHHSTPVHKKKVYPHSHKHIPRTTSHSPTMATYQYYVSGAVGRLSPSSSLAMSPPRYHGKMWIRPAAAVTRSPAPFLPAIDGGVGVDAPPSLSVNTKEEFTTFSPLMEDAASSPVRQGTNNSCSSPILGQATSFDDDMLQYASPNNANNPSLDDSMLYQYQRSVSEQPQQPPRLTFGESGKPIVRSKAARTAFERYATPAAAVL